MMMTDQKLKGLKSLWEKKNKQLVLQIKKYEMEISSSIPLSIFFIVLITWNE